MKRTLWTIIIMVTLSYCTFPLQMDVAISYGHSKTISCETDDTDDDALKTPEHMSINYARHNKRVNIERKVKVVERLTANNAAVFHATPFNYNGILNETIKRDYSGDDPVSINI